MNETPNAFYLLDAKGKADHVRKCCNCTRSLIVTRDQYEAPLPVICTKCWRLVGHLWKS